MCRKHPHGRGEELRARSSSTSKLETPPRAWGRAVETRISGGIDGNTPMGVGKRYCGRVLNAARWKHPHGRGEEECPCKRGRLFQETPPRAWGRVDVNERSIKCRRNTPTGVGKRAHSSFKQFEYYSIFFSFVKEPGSVCADFSIISCSPDMDVKSFVGMPFA